MSASYTYESVDNRIPFKTKAHSYKVNYDGNYYKEVEEQNHFDKEWQKHHNKLAK